jgi:hypothetical protein
MIPRTQRSVSTAKCIFLALVLLVPIAIYGASRVLNPAGPVGFAVLGDHADDLRAGLGIEQSTPAAVTIVLLNRWDRGGLGFSTSFMPRSALTLVSCHAASLNRGSCLA